MTMKPLADRVLIKVEKEQEEKIARKIEKLKEKQNRKKERQKIQQRKNYHQQKW